MITQEMLAVLWCPTCQGGALQPHGDPATPGAPTRGELACGACGSRYPIEDGVPALLPHNAMSTEAWEIWRKHLDKFQARRVDRIANPERAVTRTMSTSRPQQPFAKFAGIDSGRVLDVGCGPGKFRFNFDPERVQYFGLDPIALPDRTDFPFARGLAEYLPFRKASLTDVVVLAALDHFRDTAQFFREAARVLEPDGRLHILQSVHEIRGPVDAVKVLGHKVKDAVEDWNTRDHGADVPKHLSEFTKQSLVAHAEPYFDVATVQEYNATWYSPTKLFVSFTPKPSPLGAAGTRAGSPGVAVG